VIGLGIEELEFILSGMTLFSYYHHGLLGDEYYRFPDWLLPHPSDSRLKHLHLRTCVLKPPADFWENNFLHPSSPTVCFFKV
jgi:hypothetical protein